jgi:putative transcriptional regulator
MDLTGKMIVAMPAMEDPRFERAVILICAHSTEGAMGLIVNKPLSELSFSELLTQIKIEHGPRSRDIRLHFGGPVERGRGFVLHSADYARDATTQVSATYGMTATLDVLEALARGRGPEQAVLALGYTGWGPGQLEGEIARNDWLTGEASDALVFGAENSGKWALALREMGIPPLSLSPTAGRA